MSPPSRRLFPDGSSEDAPAAPDRALRAAREPVPHSWAANVREVAPLLFIGVIAFGLTYYLFSQVDPSHPTRVPLWLLSFGIGVVAMGGAGAAVFFGEFDADGPEIAADADERGTLVLVPLDEWTALRAGRAAHGPPGPAPPADELETDSLGLLEAEPIRRRAPPSHGGGRAELALDDREEPAPTYLPRRPTGRSAEELEEEIEEMIRELGTLTSSRPEPAALERSDRGRSSEASSVPWRAGRIRSNRRTEPPSPRGRVPSGRVDYEMLLTKLELDAQKFAGSRRAPPRCSDCGREIGEEESADACNDCLRPLCTACTARDRRGDGRIVCPDCNARRRATPR